MKTAVFGEILFDIIEGTQHIGGAPFNFAAHMTKLGFDTHLITCIGDDALGREALAKIRTLGMDEDFIRQTSVFPTGTVKVTMNGSEAEYEISEQAAWDAISIEDSPALEYEMWDLFYFGSLSQRSENNRTILKKLLDETLTARHVFFDANLRKGYYDKEVLEYSLGKTTILKLNRSEAAVLLKLMEMEHTSSIEDTGAAFALEYGLETVIITDGDKDVLIINDGASYTIPVGHTKIVDTVGCGDAFSAGFCFGLLQGLPAEEAGKLGSQLGLYVASKPGAVPEYSEELISTFLSLGESDIV